MANRRFFIYGHRRSLFTLPLRPDKRQYFRRTVFGSKRIDMGAYEAAFLPDVCFFFD